MMLKTLSKFNLLKHNKKIVYNIKKVEGGVMDKELFKKLDDTDIWELRTLFNGICYRLLSFWDNDEGAFSHSYSWDNKKTQKLLQRKLPKPKR